MKQYLIEDLVKMRGVCFQVSKKTSAEFQMVFFESRDIDPDNAQEAWQLGFVGITKDGMIDFSCRPNYEDEQVILAPEKFNSQKELMEFLVMGGVVINEDDEVNYFDDDGNLVSNFYADWKPRIDKPTRKWFLAWIGDDESSPPKRGNAVDLVYLDRETGRFNNDGADDWGYATPLTDSELAEFGLKRIENT